MLNGLFVRQVGQQYLIYTPQGIQVGYVFLGQDGQYAKDVVAIPRGAADEVAPLLFLLLSFLHSP